MFLSINKKIVYSISILLILTSSLLIFIFYKVYLEGFIEQKQNSSIKDNKTLIYENILLKKEFLDILSKNEKLTDNDIIKHIVGTELDETERNILDKIKTREFAKSYEEKYSTIGEAVKIFTAAIMLVILFISLLWFVINKWVIKPIDKLSTFSYLVSENLFSIRLDIPKNKFFNDEFSNLYKTFNKMLENIENNIKEIKEKEVFLQSLIDSIPDGVRVIDEKGNILISNKQYLKQIGKEDNQVGIKCYKSSQNIDTPCNKSMFTCPLTEIFKNKAKTTKTIQSFSNKPNNQLYINSAQFTTMINGKEQKLIVEAIRDLSEDIKFSHQQKLSSMGFLATAVAHEMKNNLGSIRIILEGIIDRMCKDKITCSETKNYLSMINSQVIESINVPERLLKLSNFRQESNSVIDCYDNIFDVVKLLDYEAKSKGVKINLKKTSDNLYINANSGDLKIITINLLQNALKATKDNGKININLSKKSEKVEIRVEDNGIGIKKSNLKYIFDPFYSSDKSNTNKGTGLGLSIVKSIINKFNGTIKVTSKENVGTTFTITIPLAKKGLHN